MQSCWHARSVALPPLRVVCVQWIATLPPTSRPFSSSCPRPGAVRRLMKGTKPPMRTPKPDKPAKKGATTKTAKAKPAKSAAASKPPPKKTTPKAKDRPSDRRLPGPTTQSNHIRALSFLPPPITLTPLAEQQPGAQAAAVRMADTPSPLALNKATSLFVRPAPQFLYSAPRFLNLPVNTKMPEICILGRSNVGKSTLLNALAGLETDGQAGHSHGASTGRKGLAITSAKAGCTKMLNGYGFGPPLRPAFAQTFERIEQRKDENEVGSTSTTATRGAVVSRSEKRARTPGEPTPAYSFVMVDMPGYGFMSRSEWGVEIGKYLERRGTLRGAVLLVDATTGVKDGDRHALGMLRDANVPTTVVLTKADRLLPPRLLRPPRRSSSVETAAEAKKEEEADDEEPPFCSDATSAGEQTLRMACIDVWDALKATERAGYGAVPWMEGQGWSPAICVTGAGDPKGGGFGVAGARLAICRMAGLITREQEAKLVRPTAATTTVKKHPHKGKKGKEYSNSKSTPAGDTVVPFDQIQWSATATETTIDQTAELRYIAEQEAVRLERKARHAERQARPAEGVRARTGGRQRWRRSRV